MARQQTMASLEAKEELTLKQIQELEEKLRAKKAQLKKVQTQTLTASNKKFKEYGLDLKNAALAVGIAETIAQLIQEGTTSIEEIEAMGSTVLQKEREATAIDTATSAEEHE
jgi:hypothetical protein